MQEVLCLQVKNAVCALSGGIRNNFIVLTVVISLGNFHHDASLYVLRNTRLNHK